MAGPWCHCAKWNESDRERQILYDFTFMWNLGKQKTVTGERNELLDTDNRLTVSRSGDGECVKMVKKYKLPVIR